MKQKDIKIIFEDNNYLVINKPAGLVVHGADHIQETTLVDFLKTYYPQIINTGEDKLRPGIVHRLDKEVSGLMVVAKNNDAFFSLKKQFKNRDILKEYLALVYGQVSKDSGEINFPITRAKQGNRMAALPMSSEKIYNKKKLKNRDLGNILAQEKARDAITLFQVKQRFINYTYLSVKIKTGRTHQIRVHLYAYGHPLVGDNLYSTAKTKVRNKKLALNRIFLVATQLSFRDLTGQIKDFSIALPPELKQALPKN